MLSHLVEAEAARFAIGVAPAGAQRTEVIVAIDFRCVVEVGDACGIGAADERMQRERRGAVASGKLVDERTNAKRL